METEAVEPTRAPPESFDEFFRTHFPAVARAAALILRDFDLGQETASEAFSRLLTRWERMDSPDHARNFVYRVAANLARSHLRKFSRVTRFGLRKPDGLPEETAQTDSTAVDKVVVADALRTLSARQRACVVLVDYAGYDSAGAAEVLGMNEGTVRVHVMRARRALRAKLAQDREER
ncbi:MAG TPA: sigma-70 family RNA polymerase sigma factor [Actinomycetota bacterium]|nr:sigma-70 family RNA polymerase sigma factor [Actinomycetota bacterium]